MRNPQDISSSCTQGSFGSSLPPVPDASHLHFGTITMLRIHRDSTWQRKPSLCSSGGCNHPLHAQNAANAVQKTIDVADGDVWTKDRSEKWILSCQFPGCFSKCCPHCVDHLDSCRQCGAPFCQHHRSRHACLLFATQVPNCPECTHGKQLLGNDHSCEGCNRPQCTNSYCVTNIYSCYMCRRDVCGRCGPRDRDPTLSVLTPCHRCMNPPNKRRRLATVFN